MRAPAPAVYSPPAPPRRPIPSDFDDDLPPPPRTSYRPKAARRRDDTDSGIRAMIGFLALDVVATLGMFLYLVLVETDPRHAGLIYGMGFGITLIISGLLAMWGSIWLLVIAFREDPMKGLFCMVIPGYSLYYVASRWDERRGTLALGASPLLAMVINLSVGWLVASSIRERTPPPGIAPGGGSATVASNNAADPSPPQPDPAPGAPVAPIPAPAAATSSGLKADAAQVRRGEQLIRKGLTVITQINRTLATVHNVQSAMAAQHSLRMTTMMNRIGIHRPRNLDLGPNEMVALKHRVGGEIRTAFTDFKNQFLRIKSIPGLGDGIDAKDFTQIDEIIAAWTIQPGEEQMPELVEPPAGANRFGAGHAFGPRGPGGLRPGGPGFPPGGLGPGPGAFPPGVGSPPSDFGRIPMSSNIVEQADRDYQSMQKVFGDRTASLLVNGVPTNGDPPPDDVTQAIKKRIDELAPSVRSMRGARINDRYEQAFGPVDDVQALAIRIDFGAVKVNDRRIEVDLDPKWAADVPRQAKAKPNAGRRGNEDPEIPAGADGVTRSLIELKSSDPWKRRRALERLQGTNPDGRVDQVVAALIPQLEGDDDGLASEAARAMAVWRSPEAMTALIGRMSENRHFVRSDSIKALGKYKEIKAAEAVASVIKDDIFATEEALKAMGEVAEPALIPQLRHPESMVRSQACKILGVIGGHETLAAMKSLPADPDFGVRVAANDAAEQIVRRVGPLPRNTRGKAGAARAGGPGR
ncbi:MAG: HEAT repeat domain-containing protein [Isosphaeraceae bacterium]